VSNIRRRLSDINAFTISEKIDKEGRGQKGVESEDVCRSAVNIMMRRKGKCPYGEGIFPTIAQGTPYGRF